MSYLTLSAIIPPATILPSAANSVPSGWLLCDGSAISRTVYAALFAAIGTEYGSGDEITTFNLPNTGGVFLRGAGSQLINGQSYVGVTGPAQADQMQGHLHNMNIRVSADDAGGGSITSGATATGLNNFRTFFGATGDSIGTLGLFGTPRVGSETYPAHISVKYIIKT